MLHFLKSHRLGDELDFHLLAFFEHALGRGRRARVNVQLDILFLSLLKQLVDRCHETSQQECRIIQVHKDETVGLILADRSAHRVNCRLFKERFIAFES